MNPWRGLGKLPREIWLLFIVILINRVGTMVLPFLVLYISEGLGFSAARAGIALTVYGIGALISAPIAGKLSDRLGALRIMKASLLASGATLLIFPFAKSYTAALAMTFAWAVINESFRPAGLSIISSMVKPDQRKSAFALIRLAINMGMSVGPAIGGFLATVSFKALFLIDGATSLIAGIVLCILPLTAAQNGETSTNEETTAASAPKFGYSSSSAYTDRNFLIFLIGIILIGIVFFQHVSSLPLFLVKNLRLPESAYGMLFTINTLIIILIEVPLNMAMADWDHRKTLALGTILTGFGFGALALVSGRMGLGATIVIWTFGEMILLPSSSAYVADASPAERRGEYMGLYTMTFSTSFIAAAAGPAVLEHFGASILWGGAFISAIISCAIMYNLPLPNSHEAHEGHEDL